VFWVISVYFNIRNTLPKFCPFLLGHLYLCCCSTQFLLRWDYCYGVLFLMANTRTVATGGHPVRPCHALPGPRDVRNTAVPKPDTSITVTKTKAVYNCSGNRCWRSLIQLSSLEMAVAVNMNQSEANFESNYMFSVTFIIRSVTLAWSTD